jgi:hypothetical protein
MSFRIFTSGGGGIALSNFPEEVRFNRVFTLKTSYAEHKEMFNVG